MWDERIAPPRASTVATQLKRADLFIRARTIGRLFWSIFAAETQFLQDFSWFDKCAQVLKLRVQRFLLNVTSKKTLPVTFLSRESAN